MNPEKYAAIKALDEALDPEIIKYAKRFAENPNPKDLELLDALVKVDMYCDKYLAEHSAPELQEEKTQRAFGAPYKEG